ncbi:MAG: imidazole glycerol phosphate synthase subunit HisH [Phycisphaerae bacterium]
MIAIIDYEIGNLRSVQRGLERAGAEARLVRTPQQLARADKIVLPGVAAFGDAMESLRKLDLVDAITRAVREGTPYLGFCLGLQLLFETSYEEGEHTGLGLVGGQVTKFGFSGVEANGRLAIPHMGWNQLSLQAPCPMLEGLEDGSYVYFAHSYHVEPSDKEVIATTTDYGYPFVSSIAKGNIFATQFHPEKSQAVGLRILENFVRV